MQRQFTIELRVDYDDNGKNEAMRTAVKQAAQHVFAKASMLKDSQKPTIAAFSDDWYSGREEIEVIPDTIQSGLDSIAVDGDDSDAPTPVSDELLAAFK
jgi:aspartate ammonia-lyase